jgi:prevent-host-death family protein
MPSYNVHEAKSNFSRLLKKTEQGEQVIIMRDGAPVARLVPFADKQPIKRKLGWAAGMVVETENWQRAMTVAEAEAFLGPGL